MRLYALLSLLLLPDYSSGAVVPVPQVITQEQQFANQTTSYGAIDGQSVVRTAWTVSVDSALANHGGMMSIDGSNASFWSTSLTKPYPHSITIDMKTAQFVNGFSYLPRQDGSPDGTIGAHQISLSMDGQNWGDPVAFGTFRDDDTLKTSSFQATSGRFVRFTALSEAGGRVPYATAADFQVFKTSNPIQPLAAVSPGTVGRWSATINFPLVPVAAALDVNTGNILTWSSYQNTNFMNQGPSQTVTATFNPNTGVVTQELITNTHHDMFCPGISLDANGRVVVTGGNTAPRTSIYTVSSNSWFQAAPMNIPRGYQASATCSDGRIFTIGGSFSGPQVPKNGEIYNPTTNTWTLLPGCPVAPMLTNDAGGIFRQDNHGWLFGWRNNYVFQAGPSKAMNWYNMAGNGHQVGAGLRANSPDSMCGNAVMYGAGLGNILTLGGTPNYGNSQATNAAHIITLGAGGGHPIVKTINGMNYPRVFANAVTLPNGNVFINGGQTFSQLFTDNNAVTVPEIWTMDTGAFRTMANGPTPRTYHSVAVLMLDGRVFSGGGGLCGNCATNHLDAQIYSPPYLFNPDGTPAVRPTIVSASPTSLRPGAVITIQASGPIASISMVRYGSATHTVDTDQRRIGLPQTNAGTNRYTVVVPNDPGIALPGPWMLFVMNAQGTPSVARTIVIT